MGLTKRISSKFNRCDSETIDDCSYDFSCMNIQDCSTATDDCYSPGKRDKIRTWFRETTNKFENGLDRIEAKFEGSSCSSMSSNSSNCGPCDYNNCDDICQPVSCEPVCQDEDICQPCPAPCKPKFKTETRYRTVCEQVKVPCKKTIKVPKQITCYRRKVTTECVPVTKKVWKRVDVCSTKTVKKPVKEAYCKTIMVPKTIKGCKTVNQYKKVPYQVCWQEQVACTPLVQTTCENICVPKPKCQPVCEPVCPEECEIECQPCGN